MKYNMTLSEVTCDFIEPIFLLFLLWFTSKGTVLRLKTNILYTNTKYLYNPLVDITTV